MGLKGNYKLGRWTPVAVEIDASHISPNQLKADGEFSLDVTAPDGDGTRAAVSDSKLGLEPGAKTTVWMYVKIGRPDGPLTVQLFNDYHNVVASRRLTAPELPPPLAADETLTVELGAVDLGAAIRFGPDGEPIGAHVARITSAGDLPDSWQGYVGADLVVIAASKPDLFTSLNEAQLTAPDDWLRLGGRILLSVGRAAPQTIAAGRPLARFVPGSFAGVIELDRFGAIENFAGAAVPIQASGGARPTIAVAQLTSPQGRVDVAEGGAGHEIPLVVRSPAGLGQLTFVAVDIGEPPLSDWAGHGELMSALLGRPTRPPASSAAADAATAGWRLGFDDLLGQLRGALDQFPAVRLVPFSIVIGLALAYIVLLFPLDYLLSRKRRKVGSRESPLGGARAGRVGRRRPATSAWPWFRFGLLVVICSAAVCAIGWNWKSDQLAVNRVEVVDIDQSSGLLRGQTWLSVYSPSAAAYDLQLKPNQRLGGEAERPTEGANASLTWFGLAGSGLGAMKSTPAEPFPFERPYAIEPGGSIRGAPIAAHASKCFAGQWTGANTKLISSNLRAADHVLSGTIQVSTTPAAAPPLKLTNCLLFYEDWAYTIGDFSSDKPIDVDRLDSPQKAATVLCERQRDASTPYDPASFDRRRILQIMMAYKAAGGRRYAHLSNRGSMDLDLSDDFLQLGRAVLVGVGPPATQLTVSGAATPTPSSPELLSVYRFLLPVKERGS